MLSVTQMMAKYQKGILICCDYENLALYYKDDDYNDVIVDTIMT